MNLIFFTFLGKIDTFFRISATKKAHESLMLSSRSRCTRTVCTEYVRSIQKFRIRSTPEQKKTRVRFSVDFHRTAISSMIINILMKQNFKFLYVLQGDSPSNGQFDEFFPH